MRATVRLGAASLAMVFFVAPVACSSGSSTPEAKSASRSSTDEGSTDGDSSAPAPETYCLDGTCFDCGAGPCMMGWYCDETMPGGPGCSFVPECGNTSTCACVEQALSAGCTCAERDGGAYVRCGG